MARIAGVDLPPNKRVEIGLTYIYGIGRSQSNNILKAAGVNADTEIRESDTRAEEEYQRRTEGVPVVEAAAIAVEISEERRSSTSS